ncbi:GNAT family N-acetyltransferase [Frigidibacter sp. RF13]|uniref:GNAT family N-acetyltransferase n=1 Tax=Frigidibacter sp. RF13 TaxID=2997340 RepID=UPI00226F3F95|nr:GNAT family N-acetyltransferase [Frigidibacter sp. RF13]MCY1126711.1 GNAT family N-acetyltransferase [Frigidibacter sp. RF13]
MNLTVAVLDSLDKIAPGDWDACAAPEAAQGRAANPFLTHRFLSALEKSGSIGPGTGWQSLHLAARDGDDLIGVLPLYAKSHSQGEYIFDHSWADAYERAGGRYYPKLQSAVPFTPVTGRRLLCRPDRPDAREALLGGALQLARQNDISSLHITFCTEEEWHWGQTAGLLPRLTQQFHWENRGYASFDAFLGDLSSRKRKTIRKERALAQSFGGTIRQLTGDRIEPAHWDAFWTFYQDTGSRKWGHPYLTRAFFDLIHETMRDDVMLVLAERNGQPVAGALNFIGRDTLYGRYWGAIEDHPCLHFEACYYQAIDFAIANSLARVEAGAQGDHKLARGYLPVPTYSLHWLADPGLARAVERYLKAEREAVGQEIAALADLGPFRAGPDRAGD